LIRAATAPDKKLGSHVDLALIFALALILDLGPDDVGNLE